MIRFLLLFLVSFSSFAITQQDAESFVAEGNKFFGEKNFSEALEAYQNALQFQSSAQIFFNIGQCYSALQKPGFALAYYLKAKHIEPRWTLLNRTIESFYQQNPSFTQEGFPWYHTFFSYFHWNTWLLLTTLGFCLSLCLFTLYKFFYHKKSILFSGISCLIAFCLGMFFILLNYSFKNLYICPEMAPVFFAPTDNSPIRYNFSPGRQCTIKATHAEYCFINTLDNKDGWIKNVNLISL